MVLRRSLWSLSVITLYRIKAKFHAVMSEIIFQRDTGFGFVMAVRSRKLLMFTADGLDVLSLLWLS